ncbi:MAG: hypothetical protein PHV34_08495 [Verrucomicrobiae bacterium]|nr:hypothetical protein [Verrucomicrobiae bacterium]
MKGKYSLAVSVGSFLFCWGLFLMWGMHQARERAQGHYLRCQAGVRDPHFYPGWLLAHARQERPNVPKIVFLGDSTVYGTSSSAAGKTVTGAFGKRFAPAQAQIFSFSIINIGPKAFDRIINNYVTPRDYVIIQLLPTDSSLQVDSHLQSIKSRNMAQGWMIPFWVCRDEINTLYGRPVSLFIFDVFERVKQMLRQKTFFPLPDNEQWRPFTVGKLAHDEAYLRGWAQKISTPLEKKSLQIVRELLSNPHLDPKKTMVYFTPINPALWRPEDLQPEGGFYRSLTALERVVREAGVVCFDYNRLPPPFTVDLFHDYSHLTDDGSIMLGERLGMDWQHAFQSSIAKVTP